MKRTLILYDHLHHRGGAELVTQQLAQAIPNAEVLTALEIVLGKQNSRSTDPLGRSKSLWHHHLAKLLPLMLAYGLRDRFLHTLQRRYSTILASGFYGNDLLLRLEAERKIYYCHGIPEFAYAETPQSLIGQIALPLFTTRLRYDYEKSLVPPCVVVANSRYTAQRLEQICGTAVHEIIYPPVAVEAFHWSPSDGYFLSTARLEPHKRVDLIIEVFKKLPHRSLLVAGWGSAGRQLMRSASNAPNIQFLGWVDGLQMRTLISRCTATIYISKAEPFGISPVESMAAGKPVIGVNGGGLAETILDGETGYLLDENDLFQQVTDKVLQLDHATALAMRSACETHARRFDGRHFFDAIRRLLPSDAVNPHG